MIGYGAWFQGLFVKPPVIMGVKMKPFSIIHAVVLRELGSPFCAVGGKPERGDLLIALMVCSRTYREISRDIVPDLAKCKYVGMLLRSVVRNIALAQYKFAVYLDDFASVPGHGPTTKPGKPCKAMAEWHMVRVLCSEYGISFDRAWDMPYGAARCACDCYSEANGSKTLDGPEVDAAIEQAKAIRAKLGIKDDDKPEGATDGNG